MSPQLNIISLGGFRVSLGTQDISFETRKDAALFIYLLGTGRSHPRETLAEMFWEGYSQKDAGRNLRRNLSNLRKSLGDFMNAPPREEFASINIEADIRFDFAEIEARLLSITDFPTEQEAADLQQTLQLYRGPFLEGFYGDSTEFERWTSAERDRLERRVLHGLRTLATFYLYQGQYEAGIEVANRILLVDDLDEEGHRLCIAMLALSGQRAAALRHYQTCHELLNQAFGIDPGPEITDLYERIRAGESLDQYFVTEEASQSTSASRLIQTIPNNLPSHLTPFVGRINERQDLRNLIEQSHARLITIVGLGGIGKTRIALKIAAEVMQHFQDGVFFVQLADLAASEQVIPTIIEAMDLEIHSETHAIDYLLDYLADRRVLLILDNFETVLDSAELIAEILTETPSCQIITTSREMLYLQGETLFPLEGLEYTCPDESTGTILDCDAGKLFLQSAERTDPCFTAEDGDLESVAKICRIVRGMPLAIELAAGWIFMLNPAEIFDEITRGIDILSTEQVNVPARHRSIRTIFESTWRRLNSGEQSALLKLAVFRGGFSRHSAQAVAEAGLRMLNILLSKSLLSRANDARYEIHELMQQYLNETLKENPSFQADAQVAHCHYFATFVANNEPSIVAMNQKVAIQDFENIYEAWRFAVESRDMKAISRLREGVWALFDTQGWHQEGASAFRLVINALEDEKYEGEIGINYGRCLALCGNFLGHTGKLNTAYKMIKRGTLILRDLSADEEYILSAGLLAEFATSDTQREEAKQFIEANMNLLDQSSITRIDSVLWRYAKLLEPEDAENVLQQAQKHERDEDRRRRANVDLERGRIQRRQDKPEQAKKRLLKSLEEYRTLSYDQGIAWALNELGRNALQLHAPHEAAPYFLEARHTAERIHMVSIVLGSLVGLAEAMLQIEYAYEAAVVTSFALEQSATNLDTKQNAEELLNTLNTQLTEDMLSSALAEGQAATMHEISALIASIWQ